MIALQWILIVLSIIEIDASNSSSILQAAADECPAPDIVFCDYIQCENGRCIDDKTSLECFRCLCDIGFTGKLCETTIATPSPCNPSCENGGRCEQTSSGIFTCVCPPEYTGTQCQTLLSATHPCVTMPDTVCRNGGTCAINGADYLCNCTVGWSGKNCEMQETITQCNQNPCGPHGTCFQAVLPTGPIAVCNCENRWTGKFCDVNLDASCPSGYCQAGGTCVIDGNILTCQCPPTHTGRQCETFIGGFSTTTTPLTTMTIPLFTTTTSRSTINPLPGTCSSKPCLNGGSCYNTGNNFICVCSSQWSGATCNVSNFMTSTTLPITSGPSACSSNPCNNGGSCYKHLNDFVCVCTSQFTGPTCSVMKTTTATPMTTPNPSITCANRPCQNGGVCYTTGNSYYCYCGPNSSYTGKNCEIPTSVLSTNCPLNCSPGYCVRAGNNSNAYACMCDGTLTPTSCSSK